MAPLPNRTDGPEKARSASRDSETSAVRADQRAQPSPQYRTFDEATQQRSLGVPSAAGAHRAVSPALSHLSIEDYPSVHTRRSQTFAGSPPGPRNNGPSEPDEKPATWRSRLTKFWASNKGLVLVLSSQFFGVGMNVTTRILEIEGNDGKGYSPFQILFARMSITLAMSSLYMWWKKIEHAPLGPREVRWLLALRGFGGFFGVFGMYYSLLYLPLSDATVITFLAPSLACFACSLLIKEPFTRMEQIAAFISLLGVVLIARPTSLFSSSPSTPDASGDSDLTPLPAPNTTTPGTPDAGDYTKVTPEQRAIAVAVALLGVLGAATAYTTLRWIGQRAHALISVNYFAAWCTLVSVTAMAVVPSVPFALPTSAHDWGLLVLLGSCGFVMQFLLAAGLQAERSSRATNMVYCQMLFALAGDKLVFGTSPDAWGWAGSSLILGSAVYVAVRKERGVGVGEERKAGSADEERGLVEGMDESDGEEDGEREEEGQEERREQERREREDVEDGTARTDSASART